MSESAKLKKMLRERYGENACCKHCKHAFPVRTAPDDLIPKLQCVAAPPILQFVPLGVDRAGAVQMGAQPVLRIVSDDYVCGAFQVWPDSLSS